MSYSIENHIPGMNPSCWMSYSNVTCDLLRCIGSHVWSSRHLDRWFVLSQCDIGMLFTGLNIYVRILYPPNRRLLRDIENEKRKWAISFLEIFIWYSSFPLMRPQGVQKIAYVEQKYRRWRSDTPSQYPTTLPCPQFFLQNTQQIEWHHIDLIMIIMDSRQNGH